VEFSFLPEQKRFGEKEKILSAEQTALQLAL